MDFIFDHALLSAVGIPRDTAPRALPGRKECIVKNASPARSDEPFLLKVERTATQEAHEQFTPGDFFREAGTVIAVCLVLGVLMQLLLT
jgi:hypothetical protein